MTYAHLPSFAALQNNGPLDGEVLTAAFADLSECARLLASDVLGRSCWITGGDISGQLAGPDLYAEMSAGEFYVVEDGSPQRAAATVATRTRHSSRSVLLPQGKEVLISVIPYNADARLGALQVSTLRELPPTGSAPVAWLGTGGTDIRSTVDARTHPVWGVSVNSSGEDFRSRLGWVPLTDSRVAVVVVPGERLEVTCEMVLNDGTVAEFQDLNRLPKSKSDMTHVALAYNGVIDQDGPELSLGFTTTAPVARRYLAEWIVNPFATGVPERIFRSPDPTKGGTLLLELVVRGLSVSVEASWLYVRVRPAERIPHE